MCLMDGCELQNQTVRTTNFHLVQVVISKEKCMYMLSDIIGNRFWEI